MPTLEAAGADSAEAAASAANAAQRVRPGTAGPRRATLGLLLLLGELLDRGLELLAELLDRLQLGVDLGGLVPLHLALRLCDRLIGLLGLAGEVEVGGKAGIAVPVRLVRLGIDQRLLRLSGVLPVADGRVHVGERLAGARVGAGLVEVDLGELVERVERVERRCLLRLAATRLHVLAPGIGGLAQLLLAVAGQRPVALDVRAARLI